MQIQFELQNNRKTGVKHQTSSLCVSFLHLVRNKLSHEDVSWVVSMFKKKLLNGQQNKLKRTNEVPQSLMFQFNCFEFLDFAFVFITNDHINFTIWVTSRIFGKMWMDFRLFQNLVRPSSVLMTSCTCAGMDWWKPDDVCCPSMTWQMSQSAFSVFNCFNKWSWALGDCGGKSRPFFGLC